MRAPPTTRYMRKDTQTRPGTVGQCPLPSGRVHKWQKRHLQQRIESGLVGRWVEDGAASWQDLKGNDSNE